MGLGNDDAELLAAEFLAHHQNCRAPATISVVWDHKDLEVRTITAIRELIERAELNADSIVRLGEWLVSYGKTHSFRKDI